MNGEQFLIIKNEEEGIISFESKTVRKSAILTTISLYLDKAYFRLSIEGDEIVVKIRRRSLPLTQIALNFTDDVIKFTFYQLQCERCSDKKSLILQRLAML